MTLENPIAQLEVLPIYYILFSVVDEHLCMLWEILSLKIGSCPLVNLFDTIIHA